MPGTLAREREKALQAARLRDVPGHYRPGTWERVYQGDCRMLDLRTAEFRPAVCSIVNRKGAHFALVGFVPGTTRKSYDLSDRRFPLPAPEPAS